MRGPGLGQSIGCHRSVLLPITRGPRGACSTFAAAWEPGSQGTPKRGGAKRSPWSWDLPEAAGEGGGHPQRVCLVFGTGVGICPVSSHRGRGSRETGISPPRERAKRPRSHLRSVLSHGGASENPIFCGEHPLPLILLSDIYEVSIKSRQGGLQQAPRAKKVQS